MCNKLHHAEIIPEQGASKTVKIYDRQMVKLCQKFKCFFFLGCCMEAVKWKLTVSVLLLDCRKVIHQQVVVETVAINRINFYRAMHFSAKRGIAIACRLSVRPSVCLSVCNVCDLGPHRSEISETNCRDN